MGAKGASSKHSKAWEGVVEGLLAWTGGLCYKTVEWKRHGALKKGTDFNQAREVIFVCVVACWM